MKLKLLLLVLAPILLLSCQSCKEEVKRPYNYIPIETLLNAHEEPFLSIDRMRLALAKTIANAMKHIEVRAFFYNLSKQNTTDRFNEVLFALHTEDIVSNNKSLRYYLTNAMDDEVSSLFGKDFVNIIIHNAPLLCLKIPDVFYSIDWDISSYAPFIYAKTICSFPDNDFTNIGYHPSGLQDKLSRFKNAKKYGMIIKFSEDYILMDPERLTTHQGYNFFDFFPQYNMKNWYLLKKGILAESFQSKTDPKLYYVPKKTLSTHFINWEKENAPPFISTDNCEEKCLRDCQDQDATFSRLMSLEFLEYDLLRVLRWKSFMLKETEDLFVLYNLIDNSSTGKIIDKYYLAGFRRQDFVNRTIEAKIVLKTINYENIGEVIIPFVSLKVITNDFNRIPIYHVLEQGWLSPDKYDHDFEFFLFEREAYLRKIRIGIGRRYNISDEYLWNYSILGNEYFGYCLPPVDHFPFGNLFTIEFKY